MQHVPPYWNAQRMYQAFESFGEIKQCDLPPLYGEPGRNRGYGFVTFTEVNEAKLAILQMNGIGITNEETGEVKGLMVCQRGHGRDLSAKAKVWDERSFRYS